MTAQRPTQNSSQNKSEIANLKASQIAKVTKMNPDAKKRQNHIYLSD